MVACSVHVCFSLLTDLPSTVRDFRGAGDYGPVKHGPVKAFLNLWEKFPTLT